MGTIFDYFKKIFYYTLLWYYFSIGIEKVIKQLFYFNSTNLLSCQLSMIGLFLNLKMLKIKRIAIRRKIFKKKKKSFKAACNF